MPSHFMFLYLDGFVEMMSAGCTFFGYSGHYTVFQGLVNPDLGSVRLSLSTIHEGLFFAHIHIVCRAKNKTKQNKKNNFCC